MDQDFNLNVKIDTGDAVQGLTNIKNAADQAAASVEKIGESAQGAASKVSKVDNAAKDGIPKVEGLGRAFEDVFNTVVQEGGKAGANLGQMFQSLRDAIPVVKGLNSTALRGLTGIKAALASLSVGAIVTAIGFLAAKVVDLVKKTRELKKEEKDLAKELNAGTKSAASQIVALRELAKRYQETGDSAKAKQKFIKDYADEIKKTGIAITDVNTAEEVLKNNTQKYVDALLDRAKATAAYNLAVKVYEEFLEKIPELDEAIINAGTEESRTGWQRFVTNMLATSDNISDAYEKVEETIAGQVAQNVAKATKERDEYVRTTKTKLDSLMKTYETHASRASAVLDGVGGGSSAESFSNPIFDQIQNRKALEGAVREFREKILPGIISKIQQAVDEQGSTLKFNFDEIFDDSTIEKAATRWLQYTNEIAAIKLQESRDHKKYLEERKLVEESFNKDLDKIFEDRAKEYREDNEKEAKQLAARAADIKKEIVKRKELLQEIQEMDYDHEAAMISLDPYTSEYQKNKALVELEQQRLQDRKKYLEDLLSLETKGTDEYNSLVLQLGETTQKLIEATQELDNIQTLKGRALIDYYLELTSTVSSTFSSIADMYEEDSRAIRENAEAKRRANKISEEEYQKELARSEQQFKRAKKLQIATAVVNTIAGAIGAFLQASAAYPPPYGQILGAASATAVTAAGIAEIQKLKNKNFDSDSVDGGGVGASVPNVGVTPIDVRDDIQQSPSVLADSQSPRDQRVWILQGDLEDSHRQVEIRESNSTF